MINKILVPTDGSENAMKAVKAAIKFAETVPDAKYSIVYIFSDASSTVFYPYWVSNDVYEKARTQASEAAVREAEEAFEKAKLEFNTIFASGDPGNEIVELAKEEEFDLIIMGTRGATGFNAWVPGSVAQKVVSWAPCPVLLVGKKMEE